MPLPTTSETPWRCYHLNAGSDIIFPTNPENSAQVNDPPTLEVCKDFSLVASQDNGLYVFGGSGITKHLRRIELNDDNSIATVRNIRATSISPSPRWGHCAVMIGVSLMVVWGGNSNNDLDGDFLVFNLSEFTLLSNSMSSAVTMRLGDSYETIFR